MLAERPRRARGLPRSPDPGSAGTFAARRPEGWRWGAPRTGAPPTTTWPAPARPRGRVPGRSHGSRTASRSRPPGERPPRPRNERNERNERNQRNQRNQPNQPNQPNQRNETMGLASVRSASRATRTAMRAWLSRTCMRAARSGVGGRLPGGGSRVGRLRVGDGVVSDRRDENGPGHRCHGQKRSGGY